MGSLVDEVGSDDERRALKALRDNLARHMESADSNVVAQIAGRLQAVVTRLAELGEPSIEGSASDDIARRREARRAAAQVGQAAPTGRVQRGKRSG